MAGLIWLREPTLDDLKYIRCLWGDPETMAPVGGPVVLDDQQARAWFARMVSPGSPGDCYRLIIDQAGDPVGEISFHRFDPETRTADLNIKIAARYRGNGYAKSALRQFLDFFFSEFGGLLMQDQVAKTNPIGKKFLVDFGFREIGSSAEVDLLGLSRNRYTERYGS